MRFGQREPTVSGDASRCPGAVRTWTQRPKPWNPGVAGFAPLITRNLLQRKKEPP
jgi:hypothetical protein